MKLFSQIVSSPWRAMKTLGVVALASDMTTAPFYFDLVTDSTM